MGLNLSVKRIVMSKLSKFDGTESRLLTSSELKQIAGRAGRYFSDSSRKDDYGEVTCLRQEDTRTLKKLWNREVEVP